MTEVPSVYGESFALCDCPYDGERHKPAGCQNDKPSEVVMWRPDTGWCYVAMCAACKESCWRLSNAEFEAESLGRESPRENGWDINEPATLLSRSRSGVE